MVPASPNCMCYFLQEQYQRDESVDISLKYCYNVCIFVLFFSQSWDDRYGMLDLKQSINQSINQSDLNGENNKCSIISETESLLHINPGYNSTLWKSAYLLWQVACGFVAVTLFLLWQVTRLLNSSNIAMHAFRILYYVSSCPVVPSCPELLSLCGQVHTGLLVSILLSCCATVPWTVVIVRSGPFWAACEHLGTFKIKHPFQIL